MTHLRTPSYAARIRRGAALLLMSMTPLACASAGHLAEYDFRERTVGVVLVHAPRPELLTDEMLDLTLRNPLQAVLRIGADVVKEVEAARARPRLYEAATIADVPTRMREKVLQGVAGELRARPVADSAEAEFEVEVAIKRYGIDADSWHGPAHLFIQSEVVLRDAASGRRVWKGKVTEREALTPHLLGIPGAGPGVEGVAGDILTAAALASLSTQEMTLALEALGDFASDRILRQFRRGLEKARS